MLQNSPMTENDDKPHNDDGWLVWTIVISLWTLLLLGKKKGTF